MYLEPNRDDRDYLYGRLLALADNFEESVLRKQGVKDRPTNAIKLMSNFTAKPYTTWGTLWKQLTPYLKSANGGSWFRNLELAISKHHGGLPDCIDESGNRAFLLGFTESDKSNEKYAYQEIKRGLNGLALDLQSNFRGSAEDIACFLKKIKSLGMSKDSIYFYLGLLVKLIYSRLVDADRTDAACFIRVDSSPISKEYVIMAALENKIDFAIAFEVNNANPNGDPLNGNRPRTTSEGLGEVSDVALKRKIRNRLQDAGEFSMQKFSQGF